MYVYTYIYYSKAAKPHSDILTCNTCVRNRDVNEKSNEDTIAYILRIQSWQIQEHT